MPTSPQSHRPVPAALAGQAAAWLAKRDRGLTPVEQDDYMQWLAADPRHAEVMAQHAAALERMMQLYEWQPVHTREPNPELFAPAPAAGGFRRWWPLAGLGAAAALAVGLWLGISRPSAPTPAIGAAPGSYLRVNERLALPDGSRVEMKDGTRIVVQYSETERRVKLTGGEAHFLVWKDAARPFVVEVAGVEVRAVGTAFNVRLDPGAIEVLVTEGRVKVNRSEGPAANADAAAPNLSAEVTASSGPTFVSAGERATLALPAAGPNPVSTQVTPVTLEEISRELAWQAPWLQFNETPLAHAVAEFNRLNRQQLVLEDPQLGALLIGGTYRPDNVESFVRGLATTHHLSAERDAAGRTVLRRGR